MKKILFLFSFLAFVTLAKAQNLQPADFKNNGDNRPAIDRIFKTADGSLSLIYYIDATVSFYNNDKYTDKFVVHNLANLWRMLIVRDDLNQNNDLLYYSEANQSYTDNVSGNVYILDPASIRQSNNSN